MYEDEENDMPSMDLDLEEGPSFNDELQIQEVEKKEEKKMETKAVTTKKQMKIDVEDVQDFLDYSQKISLELSQITDRLDSISSYAQLPEKLENLASISIDADQIKAQIDGAFSKNIDVKSIIEDVVKSEIEPLLVELRTAQELNKNLLFEQEKANSKKPKAKQPMSKKTKALIGFVTVGILAIVSYDHIPSFQNFSKSTFGISTSENNEKTQLNIKIKIGANVQVLDSKKENIIQVVKTKKEYSYQNVSFENDFYFVKVNDKVYKIHKSNVTLY